MAGLQQRQHSRRQVIWWMVLILLLAAGLRIIGIYNLSPPGLAHDEVANWLIDRGILAGEHAVYFTAAYGHEAGFHYLQAAAVALVGDNALALRLPAVFAGLLVVAVQFALLRRLFGARVALLAAALLAVLFWPVFYSRLGLRAITLPLVGGVSLYFWWQGWLFPARGNKRRAWGAFALAGLFAGLSLYTYMAARAVPIFYGLFFLYLLLTQRQSFRRKWRGLLLFTAVAVLVAAPLTLFLLGNPGAEFRISEVDAPLRALQAGEWRPVAENALKIAGMFGLSGDPLWRNNVAGRPVFDPLLALFFYAGIAVALWRWRDARYAFLLLWLGALSIPSLVTVDAPSSIRMIGAILVVTAFPALVIHRISEFSTVSTKLSTTAAYVLAGALLMYHIWWTSTDVFHTWPANEEVRFVWQAALTETAQFLDEQLPAAAAVGGWSPATMDPPTMALSTRQGNHHLRYFGSDSTAAAVTTLIIPKTPPGEPVLITRPRIRELLPALEAQLEEWRVAQGAGDETLWYQVPSPLPLRPREPLSMPFGDELSLLGHRPGGCSAEACTLLTFWRVESEAQGARRFFLHVVDDQGALLGQHDGLDAPAMHWQAGDLLVQAHVLPPLSEDAADLRLGVYDPLTGQRLRLADGADAFVLPPAALRP